MANKTSGFNVCLIFILLPHPTITLLDPFQIFLFSCLFYLNKFLIVDISHIVLILKTLMRFFSKNYLDSKPTL